MPRYIAFLRAVNVGGRNVAMAAMRAHFGELGLTNVETFIASGNVIFDAGASGSRVLERKIESLLAKSLGWEVSTFVRTAAEVSAIAQCRPFERKEMDSAVAFNVILLADPLKAAAAREVGKFKTAIDDFRVIGREVYWLCRKKQSDSTFTNNAFERALKVRATFRGMNTIRKLAAKYPPG